MNAVVIDEVLDEVRAAVAATRQRIGVLHGLSIEDYHADTSSISKSGLDAIARSPATYFARYLDPNRPPEKERAGQLEGSLAHCALLEPDEFDKRYFTLPSDAPRRPTEAQWNAKKSNESSVAAMLWWAEFEERTKGLTLITAQQRAVAMAQAASMRGVPEIAEAMERGVSEQSAFWIDALTGELCRCRPDWVHDCGDEGVILLDVKTFSSADPEEFARQVPRKRYETQAAFYSDGYAIASGRRVLAFVFVVVEPEHPFLASAVMLDEAAMELGRRRYRRDLDTYARCRFNNEWPGYSDSIEVISLPQWAFSE